VRCPVAPLEKGGYPLRVVEVSLETWSESLMLGAAGAGEPGLVD